MILADLTGPRLIDHLWLTFNWPGKAELPGASERARSLRLELFWDGATTPAIAAPVGDFFCHVLGKGEPFENGFFSNPSGRSYQCNLPMPFRTSARVVLCSEFNEPVDVYFDIRSRAMQNHERAEALYLHAHWNRTEGLPPASTHRLMEARGRGRYLGTHLGITSSLPEEIEWHAGPMSFQLDDTILRTATLDDYCGSSWDYDRPYNFRDSGLLFSRYDDDGGEHGLYCYHRHDPLCFDSRCAVEVAARGGLSPKRWLHLLRARPELQQSVTLPCSHTELTHLAVTEPDAWIIAERHDIIETVSLFYLDVAEGSQ